MNGIGENGLAFDIDTGDDRLFDVSRQIAADLVDLVLDVLHRLVGRHIHLEQDIGLGQTIRHRRNDIVDTGDRGNRVLDFLGHLRFELRRCCARLCDGNGDERYVDIRKARDRQREEGLKPEDHKQKEGEQWRYRITDGPGGKVHLGLS